MEFTQNHKILAVTPPANTTAI